MLRSKLPRFRLDIVGAGAHASEFAVGQVRATLQGTVCVSYIEGTLDPESWGLGCLVKKTAARIMRVNEAPSRVQHPNRPCAQRGEGDTFPEGSRTQIMGF